MSLFALWVRRAPPTPQADLMIWLPDKHKIWELTGRHGDKQESHSGPNSSRWKSLHIQAFVYLSSDLWPFVDLSHLFSGTQICCQPPSENVTQNGHLPPDAKRIKMIG